MLQVLQVTAAAATVLAGLYSLLLPGRVTGFTELSPESGRGGTGLAPGFLLGLGVAVHGIG